MKYILVHCVFLCCLTSFVFAADPDCTSAEFRQIDFWVGEWVVTYADGRPAGNSVIQKILNGCVILENWSGVDGFEGKSFNLYDRNKKKWIQKWVDIRGQLLEFEGSFRDKTLEYTARYTTLDGKNVIGMMTFTPSADGTIRQIWKQSTDEGKTWKMEFDGIYKRKEK
ncbi:hypothetical protein L0244_23855 [bacterium]|nr:hypothetical protein [bacterium]MCI0616030.1 hypothetical protein [bacterium]